MSKQRHPHQQRATLTLTADVAASFTGESSLSEGGELDLDGIDDLEIDKVLSRACRCLLLSWVSFIATHPKTTSVSSHCSTS